MGGYCLLPGIGVMYATRGGLLAMIVLLLGLLAGFYLGYRFAFATLRLVEDGTNPFDALIASWRMSGGGVLRQIGIALRLLTLTLTGMAGALLLGVGLLLSVPVALYTYCALYDGLRER